jgi:O-antigen/teichoic acid export membrane protein
LAGQATLAAGVLLFTVTGSPAAAAILAVSVRLLTGLNGVSGVVGTALYPRLADNATRIADDRAYVATALRVILSLVMAAAGVYLLGASLFMTILLGTSDEQTVGTGTLTMLAAGASGYGLLVVTVLFARNREAFALGANVVGFLVTLVGSVVVIVAGPGSASSWMAGALAAGQVVTAVALGVVVAANLPEFRAQARVGAFAAVMLAAVGVVVAVVPELHVPAACAVLVAATFTAIPLIVRAHREQNHLRA